MKIHLATDHAGFEIKEFLKKRLKNAGYDIKDHGAYESNPKDDYPDFIHPAAKAVAGSGGQDKAIIFGYSGQGEAMVANRYSGVRAAVYYGGEDDIIELSRLHNDANVLSIGAGFVKQDELLSGIKRWLSTDFSKASRHQRRIKKMSI